MSLIQANCKNCGAHLEFDDSEEKYFCSKCGTQYIYERPVTVNIENINIGGAPAEKHADFSFNMLEYATCFTKDEEQAKREWINTLMMFEDAPIDVACKAKIVWIKKQYYPVAFFDVTCTADWNAISYWEHDEQYEVLERHRKLNGEVESRLVTKHRTIVDAVQQTNGTVFPTTHCVRVWPGAEPNSPLSCEILSWIDLDSKCIEVKPGYFDNYEIMPESRKRDEVVKDASDYAHEQMYKLAEQEVPGDRYENFKAVSHIEKSEMTKRYVAVYNIKYEYNGKEFLCWISGELSDKSWFLEHPNDSYLQERINGLRNKAERILTWPWTFALILGPIPLGVIGWGLAAPASNVGKALAWLFVLAIYVFFIVMRVIAGIRESAATQDLNALISRNDRLKKQVHDLLKDNSLSEESKTASIEKWVLDSDVELQNASATSQVKKKIVITIASCFGVLLMLGIGVVAFNAIKESKVKAKAIAESKAKVEAEENAQDNARSVVNGFLKAVKDNDSEKYKTYLASDCKDDKGLLNFLSPESMNEGICSYDKITPNQLSQESLKQLTNSSVFFCKNFIASYDSLEITTDDNGTCTVKVPGKIINMQNFSNVYVSKLYELAQIINSKYADSLTEIQNTSKTQAEYTSRFYDLIIADICRAYEETVKEAGTVDVTFTFVVKEVSGEYVITEISF